MVAVFNKEVLSWYLITLKLKETLDAAGLPKQPDNNTNDDTPTPDSNLLLPTNNPTIQPDSSDPYWIIAVRDKLEEACENDIASPWAKLCIYRVPKSLREGDDKAYAPQLISLGPYHHAKRRLRHMEPHKWRSLHHVLRRTGHDVKLYLDSISELEEKARSCYEGSITLSSNEFVEMLVLGGCFAIKLFRGAVEGLGRPDQHGLVADLALRFFDPLMPGDKPLRCRLQLQIPTHSLPTVAGEDTKSYML